MKTTKLHLHSEWKEFLREELNSSNFQEIISALAIERKIHTIFPSNDVIFNAFNFILKIGSVTFDRSIESFTTYISIVVLFGFYNT